MLLALLGSHASHATSPGVAEVDTLVLGDDVSDEAFGRSVAAAGDVNGDGYADLLVGAPEDTDRVGRVYVYLGSPGGIDKEPAQVLVGAAWSQFGASIAGGGDVDLDGYDDVVVGAYGGGGGTGEVSLFRGGPGGLEEAPSAVVAGQADSYHGISVALGDIDGDGHADVIIGAPQREYEGGRVFVHHGSKGGLASAPTTVIADPSSEETGFGFDVAYAGDVNGDGYGDVIVGAYRWSASTGRAHVYHGSAAGLGSDPVTTISGTSGGDRAGFSVAGAGDVDGDGYDDVLVGAYGYGSDDRGQLTAHHGGMMGVLAPAALTVQGGAGDAYLGVAMAGLGDLDRDGYAEVAVAAPGHDGSKGLVAIHQGSASGLLSTAALGITGRASDDEWGHALAGPGDVNGDGVGDVLIGCGWNAVAPDRAAVTTLAVDADLDGWWSDEDCDDRDGSAFPGAPEVEGDGIDQDCDGEDAGEEAVDTGDTGGQDTGGIEDTGDVADPEDTGIDDTHDVGPGGEDSAPQVPSGSSGDGEVVRQCGCATGARGVWWPALMVALFVMRRRR